MYDKIIIQDLDTKKFIEVESGVIILRYFKEEKEEMFIQIPFAQLHCAIENWIKENNKS